MSIDPESLGAQKDRHELNLLGLAAQTESVRQEGLSILWQEDLIDTLQRGGDTRSKYPYDFDGAWRLIESDEGWTRYSTVIAREELPAGVEPRRPVVGLADLAISNCIQCSQGVPLIGRSVGAEFGFGDVTYNTEVAVVHCDTVQLKLETPGSDDHVTIQFRPQQHLFDQSK